MGTSLDGSQAWCGFFFHHPILPPGKGPLMSPVPLPQTVPGLQPVCGAHFLSVSWHKVSSKQ